MNKYMLDSFTGNLVSNHAEYFEWQQTCRKIHGSLVMFYNRQFRDSDKTTALLAGEIVGTFDHCSDTCKVKVHEVDLDPCF